MRRRTWALALAGLVALLAVIWGALVAAGLSPGGEEGVTKPSGSRNVLRVEPVLSSVSCSDQKRTVLIFLDDLEARPSLTGAEANRGFAGFELTLHYDPKILQIEVPLDVRLNPELSLEDPDGDGLARNFIPGPTTIDNFAGTVYMGAVGIGPGTEEGKSEEGPDPVAKGAPLLLFSVEFLTVGEGTSPLTVTGAGLADSAVGHYTPLEIREGGMTVSGGDCAEPLPATPRPTQVLTPPPSTVTPVVVSTPVKVTPVPAGEGGRPDCPEDWAVYNDPDGHFSVCYPQSWYTVTSRLGPDSGRSVSVSNFRPGTSTGPDNPIFVTLIWRSPRERPYLEASHCEQFEGVWGVPVERITLAVAGTEGDGCRALGTSMNVDEGSFELLVPSDLDGGVIEVFVGRAGPDIALTEASVLQILGTLKLQEP